MDEPCQNHLMWSATSTPSGDGELIWSKFASFLSHVVNKHANLPDPRFNKCLHDADIPATRWLEEGEIYLFKMTSTKEKEVTSCEKRNNIKARWKLQDRAFDNAKQRLVSKKKTLLILKMHRLAAERVFLIEMKKKYVDGQGIAIKLSNQITKASNTLQKFLTSLNALRDDVFTFDEVKRPESVIYNNQGITTNDDQIPDSNKKVLINLTSLKDSEMRVYRESIVKLCDILNCRYLKSNIVFTHEAALLKAYKDYAMELLESNIKASLNTMKDQGLDVDDETLDIDIPVIFDRT
ncbi:hypothetical protein AC249_AIPGENE12525 [Exaiptasia diaphana]|nr:hypothetical protein AC249_AIPGENE12525 [Exaiptasia diaphana]